LRRPSAATRGGARSPPGTGRARGRRAALRCAAPPAGCRAGYPVRAGR